ncbi:hypothetical protein [Paenibacillus maysiensis]|nr:hypothetical protein [Paenibacillus maysiensis]
MRLPGILQGDWTKAAAWLQKLSTGNPAALTAAQALQMATVNVAKLKL